MPEEAAMSLLPRCKTALTLVLAVVLAACSALPKLESDSVEYKSASKNRPAGFARAARSHEADHR
jgi:hypothetical protein